MEQEAIDDFPGSLSMTVDDVDNVLNELLANPKFKGWRTGKTVDVGGKRWRPHAISPDDSEVLYVSLVGELPRYVLARLQLAGADSVRSVVALNVSSLYEPNVVTELARIDADVVVLDDYREDRRHVRRHILAAIADIEVPIDPEVRRTVGMETWGRISFGSAHQKGRRLEALLALVFSQVADVRVVERNLRGASDEVDLVLQVDNRSQRAWQKPGVPFILIEAKNRTAKATQQDVSALIAKLETKRGSAKFGILVATAGFTQDATLQVLKFATRDDVCVPLINRASLERLLTASDLDEELDQMVRRALLR